MQDLDPTLRDEIDSTFRRARKLLSDGQAEVALDLAQTAWGRLPDPKFDWDVSQSYVHALALIYRDTHRYSEGLALMKDLFTSGTVLEYEDRPRFVLGTIYFDMGDIEEARRWLIEANRISRGRCFRDEPEKYRLAIAKK